MGETACNLKRSKLCALLTADAKATWMYRELCNKLRFAISKVMDK